MFRNILEAQAPAKQTATDTISTLSSRLQSATLLEDRRAAILGLRSFAKTYPASVASGSLRELINALRKNGDDVDTIKVVLETLLMLFDPDANSPESSDEISLWLADEFTQRQDNITVLLDLLDTRDFYSRLYSLQLITAISAARPDRTQECIFTAPLGISRLVAVLDDRREAVRNEALLLLTALTPSSGELQKLVAFENAFERIFALIEAEGSMTHGSVVVQDCLSLLANLLRLNISNQSYFRETGCISKLAKLLAGVIKEQDSEGGVSAWARPQRDKNLWGLLVILRLFLVRGVVGTPANQAALWQAGVVQQVLHIAFSPESDISIQAESLSTCADLIRGNAYLQQRFGNLEVDSIAGEPSPQLKNGKPAVNGIHKVNVIEALLKLALEPASSQLLEARLAANECIQAYFSAHAEIHSTFLRRAIEGHVAGDDQIPNLLTVLVDGTEPGKLLDPYQPWMASVLLFHLLYEDPEAKAMAMKITEGDAESGEEVVTCVQAIAANLITGMLKDQDERISVGYLTLLCGWLFEDLDVVNDFLSEGSSVQSLIQAIEHAGVSKTLVPGLCAVLLGIVYEFSTKDSPVPRATLHKLLTTRLGREQYIDKITKLRELPLVRDFEVLPKTSSLDGHPEVFFDKTFIDFLKDNSSRLIRAIDRDPGVEVPVVANGVQKGISRELVDSLRAQVDDRGQALQKVESEMLALERKLEQEQLDHRKTKQSATVELTRIKQINDSLQKNHEEELRNLEQTQSNARNELLRQHQEQLRGVENQIRQMTMDSVGKANKIRERHEAERADLKETIKKLETEFAKSKKDHIQDLQTAHEEYLSKSTILEGRMQRAEEKVEEAEERARKAEAELKDAQIALEKSELEARAKEEARVAVQNELDDLLIVFGDLEAKRNQDKKRLKDLGETVSDGENEDEGDEDGDADDDVDDDDGK